ncbi:MAG: hypothetical protein M5R36_16825 [Deltaproteobacteria bacterium]|nr:hypothetical protein [Deltaproteobacteria bacterium]
MRKLILLGAALLLLSPAAAPAQDTYHLPQADQHWRESPRHFSAGFQVGMIFPTHDDVTDVYGTKGDAIYTLHGGWRMVHELELHAEGAYTFYEGNGVDPTGGKTKEKYKLHIAPAEVGLLYRFAFWPDQIVVPYAAGHYVYTYWFEEKLDSADKNRGLISGWSAQGGLMLLLDDIEKRASGRLESDWGVNNTYLVYQYKYMAVDDFGQDQDKTLDLSAQVHTLGVTFQF